YLRDGRPRTRGQLACPHGLGELGTERTAQLTLDAHHVPPPPLAGPPLCPLPAVMSRNQPSGGHSTGVVAEVRARGGYRRPPQATATPPRASPRPAPRGAVSQPAFWGSRNRRSRRGSGPGRVPTPATGHTGIVNNPRPCSRPHRADGADDDDCAEPRRGGR